MYNGCPDNLLPGGPVCPRCGVERGASGVDGGSWVHCPKEMQGITTYYKNGKKVAVYKNGVRIGGPEREYKATKPRVKGLWQ